MFTLKRSDSEDVDFVALVRLLDADLAKKNGAQNDFYAQYNQISYIRFVVVAYAEGQAIACGAIKEIEPGLMEIKRMFTHPKQRGQGVASQILSELEKWSLELGAQNCVLETGKFMPDAIRLYEKNGYTVIENYGQYLGVEDSICFKKTLAPKF